MNKIELTNVRKQTQQSGILSPFFILFFEGYG